jgi:uncharacterized membrane protein YwaF
MCLHCISGLATFTGERCYQGNYSEYPFISQLTDVCRYIGGDMKLQREEIFVILYRFLKVAIAILNIMDSDVSMITVGIMV